MIRQLASRDWPCLLIVVLALLLRLPLFALHPQDDEPEQVWRALHLLTGDLDPRWFLYPSGFLYGSAAFLLGQYALGHALSGAWPYQSLATFVEAGAVNVEIALPAVRAASLLAALVCLVAVYGLGVRLGSRQAGVCAALCCAVAPLHVRHSVFALPEMAMTSLSMVALWLATGPLSSTRVVLLGAAAGAACSFKYSALPIVPVALTAGVLDILERRSRMRRAAATFLAIGVAFLALSPFVLVHPQQAAHELWFELRGQAMQRGTGAPIGAWVWFWLSWRYGTGAAATLLALGGLLLCQTRPARLVRLFIGLSFLTVAFAPRAFPRYALAATPAALVLAALTLERLAVLLSARQRTGNGLVLAGLLVLACIEPLASTIGLLRVSGWPDSRTLARTWIESNWPDGGTIVLIGWYGMPRLIEQRPHLGLLDTTPAPAMPEFAPDYARGIVLGRYVGRQPHPAYRILRLYPDQLKAAIAPIVLPPNALIVMDAHPHLLHCSPPLPAALASALETLELVWRCVPYSPDHVQDGVYSMLSGDYLPVAGFRGLERPGPEITIRRTPLQTPPRP